LRVGSNVPEPAEITSQSDTMLVANVPPDLSTTPAVLVVRCMGGAAAAVPLTFTTTEEVTQTYHYAIAADGASIGDDTASPLAASPADGSWALRYRTWADDTPHYYSLQEGAYLREALPYNVPDPQRSGLAIDGNGTTHIVGGAAGSLAHAWRAQGDTTWNVEAIPGTAYAADYVLRVDPLSDEPELVYMRLQSGQYVLCWTGRVDGAWTYPELIEDRVGDLYTCAFTIDQDGIDRVAYIFQSYDSDTCKAYYRTRISHGGSWAEPEPIGPVAVPSALSIVVDPVIESPEVAFIDYDPWGYKDVFYASRDLGRWNPGVLMWSNSIWDLRLMMSAAGVTHLVVFEAPSAQDSGCVHHLTRVATPPGGFREWQGDTVVASGLGTVPGPVLLPIDMAMQGEAPLIEFGCGAPPFLYVASPTGIAAVAPVATMGLCMRGPWPNPTRNGRSGRIALTAGRPSSCECSVFDVSGKLIRREHYEVAPGGVKWVTLGAGELRSGMYFVRVRSAHERELVQKWVVLR
jgi:hypothetical protein